MFCNNHYMRNYDRDARWEQYKGHQRKLHGNFAHPVSCRPISGYSPFAPRYIEYTPSPDYYFTPTYYSSYNPFCNYFGSFCNPFSYTYTNSFCDFCTPTYNWFW